MWNDEWAKSTKKPYRIFYIQRCYRYERPQAGRYREFTQAGVEILGGQGQGDTEDAVSSLRACLDKFSVPYNFNPAVKRGESQASVANDQAALQQGRRGQAVRHLAFSDLAQRLRLIRGEGDRFHIVSTFTGRMTQPDKDCVASV
jgi:hypothetical protein